MSKITSVNNERVQILYERAFYNITTAVSASLILVYIYRDQIAFPILLPWLAFMLFGSFIRYWNLFEYIKKNNTPTDHKKFENLYAYFAGIIGLGWAFFIVTALALPVFEYRMYSILLTTAIIAVAVPVFSPSMKTLYYYISPSLLISVTFLLSQGGNDAALGVALIVFSAMVILAGRQSYTTLNDTLTLRHETKTLAKNLKQLQLEKSETELCMQAIMDHAPASIYVKNLDGEFTFANQKVASLYNMTHDKVIGKTLYDIYPKDIADIIVNNDNEVIAAEKPLEHEEHLPRDDGLHHYISINFPLYDETNNICGVGGISTDITERVLAEESLRISQQRLLLHREQSPVGIVEWNTKFEVTAWNPAVESIFGYTEEEVMGKYILDWILPESAQPQVKRLWEDLLDNKGSARNINENITTDGRVILCEWHSTPLVDDDDGNIIGVTSIVSDVTKKNKQEERERQMQKMDAIGQLTGGIAHDFNNMLGVILGFSGLLKKSLDGVNPKQLEYCNQILKAGDRAKSLTSNLLEFSSTAPSSEETIEINEILSSMKHMLETTLTARIKLTLELGDDLWSIYLDRARLEDAILNMSINAMHAMPEGGKLTMNSSTNHLTKKQSGKLGLPMGDYVVLSIADTGSGMPLDVQQKIFEPFYTTKGTEGTGLGLSQVYGFAQQAGGTVEVFSEIGQGTRLNLYFPRCTRNDVAEAEDEAVDPIMLEKKNDTILVVDDEDALLSLNKDILTTAGYNVLLANGAEQALENLKNKRVDLMLSDVIMPEVNGYQLAAAVEKLYPEVKIQMVSGFSDKHCKVAGNDNYRRERLSKPIAANTLLRKIAELLDAK